LSCGVQLAGATWCAANAAMSIVAGVGDLVQRTEDGRTGQVLGAGQSRGRVASCAVYTVHVETRSVGFLVEPQNQGRQFVSSLASKPLERFLIGLDLKTDGDCL
jgi:hypothetical protein